MFELLHISTYVIVTSVIVRVSASCQIRVAASQEAKVLHILEGYGI
jgi:hypothetical protein